MIYLAMYKGRDTLIDRIVQYATNSIYSHCELYVDGICYSSSLRDRGVRDKEINIFDSSKWDIFHIDKYKKHQILTYYQKTKGYRYSVLEVCINYIFKTKFDIYGAIFCSCWCGEALGIPNAYLYNPATLLELQKYVNANTD